MRKATSKEILFVIFLGISVSGCKTAFKNTSEYDGGFEFEKMDEKINRKNPKADPVKTDAQKITTANASLKKEIESWLGTPYKYGGTTRQGIDCSAFCGQVYKNVYNITLGRSANDIYEQSKPVKKEDLREGDFVFFKINSSKVSHVGIYLSQNKFVHASTSRGVVISDLTDTYYTKYFFSGGRIK
jgi:lipoprotein Spr